MDQLSWLKIPKMNSAVGSKGGGGGGEGANIPESCEVKHSRVGIRAGG